MRRVDIRRYFKALLLTAIVSVTVLSCHKEYSGGSIPEPELSYRIVEGSYQTYRKCDFENILSAYVTEMSLSIGVDIPLAPILRSLLPDVLSDTTTYGSVAMQYRSVNLSGNGRWLSGRIFFSIDGDSTDPVPMRCPEHFLLACHHTVSSDLNTPSITCNILESLLLQQGGLVVVPDCLGFGSTTDIVHPYCHPVSGRNSVDMLLAAREFCRDRGIDTDSLPSYIEGYSEGGYTALASVKYICQNSLQNTLRLEGTVCGGGPYSHIATFDNYIDVNRCPNPIAVPYLIISYKSSFPYILTEDYDKYFSRELIDAGVVDIIVNRRYNQFEVDALISRACNADGRDKYTRTDRILSPEAFDRGSEIYSQIMTCGSLCDLTEGWTISTPVRFFHGVDDDVVSSRAVMKVRENLSNEYTAFELPDKYPSIFRDITGLSVHEFYGLVFYLRMITGDYAKH